ncbi:Maf-like protein [Derxia gummosa]|uniref:7-methyl-GTP pyrophosphatase n=1 Tax=Derxia gummosa DSM 723 TaxID=1121388 RepID=A0A8B6X6K6_9BURK|nr:Maf-like protein [Derxia gummosa]
MPAENNAETRLILASTSAYRRELLARLRVPFDTARPEVDETPLPGESAEATSLRLAIAKARAIGDHTPGALIIGSDQVATLDGRQIGKPGSHERALEQLRSMRGRDVLFHTAVALHDTRDDSIRHAVVTTAVRFRDLPDAELDAYLRIEQPYDCAGSAKSEGLGIALIECMTSDDPTALVGLPLITVVGMLREAGFPFFGGAA